MNLSFLSLIIVSGPDAAKFLQGQLTCDVREITPERSVLGAYCNQKGRVLAIFQLFLHENNFYLVLPKTIAESTFITLKKYAVFSKVTLTIANDFTPLLPNPYFKMAKWSDENSWQKFNIENGIPTIYPQTTEMFTPHMLNLPALGAVNFNKGCYLGQEIIARTEYLGKAKRQLFCFKMTTTDCEFSPGDPLFANKIEVGNIVNIVQITNNYYELLAVIQVEELQQGVYLKNSILKINSE